MGHRAQQVSAQAENHFNGKNSSTLTGEVSVKICRSALLRVSDYLLSKDLIFHIF